MLKLDDSGLQAKVDAIYKMLQDLLDLHRLNTVESKWKTLFFDDFTTSPLGDLPIAWNAQIPWVGANQPGCSTKIILVDGKKTLECSITDAYHKSQGARAFYHPQSPRWDLLQPYVGQTVRITYRQRMITPFTLEAGNQLWTTSGLEIKDHDGPAAVAIDLVDDTRFALQHWTDLSKERSVTPVRWNTWFTVEVRVILAKDSQGFMSLQLADGTDIFMDGQTANAVDGGSGVALCLYGNNIIGGKATCQFQDFRIENMVTVV